jgi:hypothetical protein
MMRREYSWPYWDLNSDLSVVQLVANPYTDGRLRHIEKTAVSSALQF